MRASRRKLVLSLTKRPHIPALTASQGSPSAPLSSQLGLTPDPLAHVIMATEADTSGSKNTTHSFQHHHRLHQPLMFYPADVTVSSPHQQRRGSRADDADKLISVDDFDDSDDDSCSTASPTPSYHELSSNLSHHYNPANSSHKMRRKGVLTSKVLDEQELQSLRLKINSRERKRMHDLNSALDGLREVMPYAHGPSVRKLSKIATLLLARNYILMLNSSLEEMKKLVTDIYQSPVSSRRTSPQLTPRSSVPASGVVDVMGTSACSDSSAKGFHDQSTAPSCKASQSLPAFALPSTSHTSPLPAHQPASLMLPLPALRSSLAGLTPHDIAALTSAYALPKCDGDSAYRISQTFPGQFHMLHRLTAPCACAQCLSGVSHLRAGLQLSRISDPLFTSSAFLRRKN